MVSDDYSKFSEFYNDIPDIEGEDGLKYDSDFSESC